MYCPNDTLNGAPNIFHMIRASQAVSSSDALILIFVVEKKDVFPVANWRLIFAPEEVLDYIVVHELAHRREMKHSRAFYAIIEEVLPDYKKCRQWLKENGQKLWHKLNRRQTAILFPV